MAAERFERLIFAGMQLEEGRTCSDFQEADASQLALQLTRLLAADDRDRTLDLVASHSPMFWRAADDIANALDFASEALRGTEPLDYKRALQSLVGAIDVARDVVVEMQKYVVVQENTEYVAVQAASVEAPVEKAGDEMPSLAQQTESPMVVSLCEGTCNEEEQEAPSAIEEQYDFNTFHQEADISLFLQNIAAGKFAASVGSPQQATRGKDSPGPSISKEEHEDAGEPSAPKQEYPNDDANTPGPINKNDAEEESAGETNTLISVEEHEDAGGPNAPKQEHPNDDALTPGPTLKNDAEKESAGEPNALISVEEHDAGEPNVPKQECHNDDAITPGLENPKVDMPSAPIRPQTPERKIGRKPRAGSPDSERKRAPAAPSGRRARKCDRGKPLILSPPA